MKCDTLKNTSYRKERSPLSVIFSEVFGKFREIFLWNYSDNMSLYLLVEEFLGFSALSSADKIKTISPLN